MGLIEGMVKVRHSSTVNMVYIHPSLQDGRGSLERIMNVL